jgi:hypothetical protein
MNLTERTAESLVQVAHDPDQVEKLIVDYLARVYDGRGGITEERLQLAAVFRARAQDTDLDMRTVERVLESITGSKAA